MVEAAPSPSFKMSQPDLLLEFLDSRVRSAIAAWQCRRADGTRRLPEASTTKYLIGSFSPSGHSINKPLLRPTVGEPVIPMRDTNAHTGQIARTTSPPWLPPWIVRQARFGKANASFLTEAGLCLSSRRTASVVAHDPTTGSVGRTPGGRGLLWSRCRSNYGRYVVDVRTVWRTTG